MIKSISLFASGLEATTAEAVIILDPDLGVIQARAQDLDRRPGPVLVRLRQSRNPDPDLDTVQDRDPFQREEAHHLFWREDELLGNNQDNQKRSMNSFWLGYLFNDTVK